MKITFTELKQTKRLPVPIFFFGPIFKKFRYGIVIPSNVGIRKKLWLCRYCTSPTFFSAYAFETGDNKEIVF